MDMGFHQRYSSPGIWLVKVSLSSNNSVDVSYQVTDLCDLWVVTSIQIVHHYLNSSHAPKLIMYIFYQQIHYKGSKGYYSSSIDFSVDTLKMSTELSPICS